MTFPHRTLVILLALLLPGSLALDVKGQEPTRGANLMTIYIGTYTGPKSKGIYMTRLDPVTGSLSAPEVAAELKNPSFLTIAPSQKFLYAIGEVDEFKGQKTGGISAYSIDPTSGKLTLLNQQ